MPNQNSDDTLFDDWIKFKKRIHQLHKLHKLPTIREGEIWWCGVSKCPNYTPSLKIHQPLDRILL